MESCETHFGWKLFASAENHGFWIDGQHLAPFFFLRGLKHYWHWYFWILFNLLNMLNWILVQQDDLRWTWFRNFKHFGYIFNIFHLFPGKNTHKNNTTTSLSGATRISSHSTSFSGDGDRQILPALKRSRAGFESTSGKDHSLTMKRKQNLGNFFW